MKQEGDFELLESEKAKLKSDEIMKGLKQDPIQLQQAKEKKWRLSYEIDLDCMESGDAKPMSDVRL